MEPNNYFRTDSVVHEVKTNLLFESPLLSKLVKNNPGFGSKERPLLLDIDRKTFDCVIEVLRNGKIYNVPSVESDIVSKFISNTNIDPIPQLDFIEVNVSGELFYTTIATLSKSTYFSSFIEWNSSSSMPAVINIDRNSKSFRHILKYMRNPKYVIPQKYLYEDYFYGVFDKFKKCDNQWKKLDSIIDRQLSRPDLDPTEKYLVGNPQITHHKLVYRRHTLFTRNNKQVIGLQSSPNIIMYDIDTGNILNQMFVHFVPCSPDSNITDLKIRKIELITDNDFVIDSNSWGFIQMNLNLFNSDLKKNYLTYLEKNELYVPLFFNTNNPGLGLPMDAIKNKIRLQITLENNVGNKYKSRLVYKYNNLDTEEKRRFEQVSHEYLYRSPLDLIIGFDNYMAEVILPFSGVNKWIIFKIESDSNYRYPNDLLLEADLYVNNELYMRTDPLISAEDFFYGTKMTSGLDLTNYYVMPFCINIL